MDLIQSENLLSSDSSNNEGECKSRQQWGELLYQLYKENKFHEILTIIPRFEEFYMISNFHRLLISLTLFCLGRFKAGLRHLGVIIELEINPIEKKRYLNYLIKYFEILHLDRIEPILMEVKLLNEETELEYFPIKLQKYDIPIHQQTLNYLEVKGDLTTFCLGTLCLEAHTSLSKAKELILREKSAENVLDLLFSTIITFPPLYVFDLINEPSILKLIHNEANKYAINDKTPEQVLVNLDGFKCGSFVKIQVILAFLKFINNNYENSCELFIWILLFIKQAQKSVFPNYHHLFSVIKRVCVCWICNNGEFGNVEFSVGFMNCILNKLSTEFNINLTSEFSTNRLNHHFISMGWVLEQMAHKELKSYEVEGDTLYMYDPTYIIEMIRKYILASTYKAPDDSTVLELYDRILWGLLVLGGTHLSTIWYFQNLKNYFLIQFESAPIHIRTGDKYKAFNGPIKYENLQEILNRINNLGFQLTSKEKDHIWELETGNSVLLPNVFVSDKKMVLATQFHNVNSFYFESKNFTIKDGNMVLKNKGQCKIPNPMLRYHFELSREFIDMWRSSYETFHGGVPDI